MTTFQQIWLPRTVEEKRAVVWSFKKRQANKVALLPTLIFQIRVALEMAAAVADQDFVLAFRMKLRSGLGI
jgi:hypothetical protein